MAEFDHGPSESFADLFARVPAPSARKDFWFDWGPIFYRGRLDGSARVVCVASDPGATERIAGRTLVGNAGQRVQGLLAKLGLTRSYVCVNAWAYAVHPSQAQEEEGRLDEQDQLDWRNELYDAVAGPQLEAVIAFGGMAQRAVELWTPPPNVRVEKVPHPSSHDPDRLLRDWRKAVEKLRGVVTPDDDGDNTGPNYGDTFEESDYTAIPRRDLPFGAPAFLGDDAWLRAIGEQSAVARPKPDDGHTLIWHAPGWSP